VCRYAECRYAECHFAECRYAECRYAECHYAVCRYAECRYAECRYAECHYAECRYAECRGALDSPHYKSVNLPTGSQPCLQDITVPLKFLTLTHTLAFYSTNKDYSDKEFYFTHPHFTIFRVFSKVCYFRKIFIYLPL